MKNKRWFRFLLLVPVLVIGCTKTPEANKQEVPQAETPQTKKEAKVKANLAKLSDVDRPLAEAQKFCAVQKDNLLGIMGKPDRIELDGQPVFLCCAGCEDEARADPKKTLALVAEFKAKK